MKGYPNGFKCCFLTVEQFSKKVLSKVAKEKSEVSRDIFQFGSQENNFLSNAKQIQINLRCL